MEVVPEMMDLETLRFRQAGHVFGAHVHQHVALMQHLVVLHVVQ